MLIHYLPKRLSERRLSGPREPTPLVDNIQVTLHACIAPGNSSRTARALTGIGFLWHALQYADETLVVTAPLHATHSAIVGYCSGDFTSS